MLSIMYGFDVAWYTPNNRIEHSKRKRQTRGQREGSLRIKIVNMKRLQIIEDILHIIEYRLKRRSIYNIIPLAGLTYPCTHRLTESNTPKGYIKPVVSLYTPYNRIEHSKRIRKTHDGQREGSIRITIVNIERRFNIYSIFEDTFKYLKISSNIRSYFQLNKRCL